MAAAAETKELKEGQLRNTLAPLPETRRGYATHMYAINQKPSKTAPGGDKLIYTNGRSVIVRDLADPSKAWTFTEHKAKVNVAQFSPNGEWVASGDDEGRVIVWSASSQIVKQTVPVGKSILDLAWDSEGKRIVAVGDGAEAKAKVFAWDTGNNVGTIDFHSKAILSVAYKPTRPFRIVTSSEDLLVNFYEGPPFKFKSSAKEHDRYPNVVRFSPDGAQFASIGSDQKVLVYNGTTGEIAKRVEDKENGHKGAIFSFAWSPDGTQLLTASADRTAKLWSIAESKVLTTFTFPPSPNTIDDQQMSALWHGSYMLTVSLSGQINYLDVANPSKPKLVVQGHKENITAFAFESKSRTLYTSDLAGKLARWNMDSGMATWFTGAIPKTVVGAAISCDGERLATISLDDRIRINETKTGAYSTAASGLPGRPVAVAAASRNGNLFAVVTEEPALVLVRDGAVGETISLDFAPLNVAFSVDDSELTITGKANILKTYTVSASGATVKATLEGPIRNVNAAAYSADGKFLVAVDANRRVSIYDAARTNKSADGWQYHSSNVTDAAFSPSSARLVTCSMDESIIVYDDLVTFVPEKRRLINLAHTGGVQRVAWLSETSLVTAGGDRSLKVWDLPPKRA